MTKIAMPEPVAWLVKWESEGKTWAQAHASEVPARDQALRNDGRVTELCPAAQMEAYAAAKVRDALEDLPTKLMRAITSCPHDIDKQIVHLYFDDGQVGNNALNQIRIRITSVIDELAPK